MLQSYVPDPGMQMLVKDSMFKNALNKGNYAANDLATAQRLGLTNESLNPRGAGMKYASSEGAKANGLRNSAVSGYTTALDAASALNDAFTELATNVAGISSILQGVAGVSGFATGFGSTTPGQVALGAIGSIPIAGPILSKVLGSFMHAGGGPISGPGGPKDDKVPALLSNGEFVVQASAVNKYGVDLFERLNAKRFADGGYNSPSEAVQWALSHQGQDLGYSGLCDHFVAQAYGLDHSGYDSAATHFQSAKAAGQIHTDTNPPAGALVYWDTGANGHIALSVGGGKVASTDFTKVGQENVVPIADITQKWGSYLGWSPPYYDGQVRGNLGGSTSTSVTGSTSTLSSASGSATTGSSAPSLSITPALFTGVNLNSGVSGVTSTEQGITSAMSTSPIFADINSFNGSTASNTSASTSGTDGGVTGGSAPPGGNPTYQGTDDGKSPIDINKILDNPSNNRSWAQSMAASRGWSGTEWDALKFVWEHESGFHIKSSDGAQGSSGDGNWGTPKTWGIPQSNPGHKMKEAGPDWRTNALTQIKWGLDYISQSYGSPSKAKEHGMSTGHTGSNDGYGWYSKGAWSVEKDQIAHIHQNEMILPAPAAEAVRTVMREQRAGQTSSSSNPANSNNVVINLTVAKATDDDATRVAMKVKRILDDDRMLHSIATGTG